ncbi:hypothetical protein [Roseibacillus persicicus]|uniref:Uncharacterized protein n=1 Tax=Roseibacillus persicicus TaxID=454148 RepID=A0A918TTP3_9BACT|nr:hypothetical protein [Roseibacillus persicicus]MDQ8191586.1 hypothetical protein [Roseibacillus persicicus]GHC60739.1 hypothetical protein GCM10007100_30180 [Roseibacillus persicicus]
MSETLFDIPTKDLPSANAGEVIFGQIKVESVTDGIAHVTFTPSTRSKPAPGARTWAERIAGKGEGDHLRKANRNLESERL